MKCYIFSKPLKDTLHSSYSFDMDKSEETNNFKDLSSHVKSKLTTRKLQELAAELMTVNDKTNALKLYNRSIAVSPSNAIDLPIAYANKSAVLLEMKDYEACVGNINLALKHPLCPVWLVSALYERKIKCLLIMGQWNDSTEKKLFKSLKRLSYSNYEKNLLRIRLNQYLSHVYYLIENSEDKIYEKFKSQKWKRDRKHFNAYNSSVVCASDNICIVQNNIYGRHILAKNDIKTGELLIKEKAVISYLYMNEVYDYCSCCLMRTRILIPCNHCSKALFCSKYCSTKAMEQYHRIECPLMEYFACLEPEDQHVQYIMRLICFLSNQGQKLDELIEKWRELKNRTESKTNETKAYTLPKNYQTLFLSFDKHEYSPVQFAYSQSRYTKLVEKLKEKTDFFVHHSSETNKHYFQYLVTNLLIDLEAQFKCNSFCVSDTMYTSDTELTAVRKNVGLACYQESNLFNHSCLPNAAYCFENGDTVSTYSLRRIRAGEQIFICYLNTYYEMGRSKRDLMKSYSFQCKCVACMENWPPFEYLQSMYDIRFCECEHHNAFSRRLSVIGCQFCRFKRDLAISLKQIRETLETELPFHRIAEKLKKDVSEAMDLFQSVEGIEVHLIKEYVELYRLFCRCIEMAGNVHRK